MDETQKPSTEPNGPTLNDREPVPVPRSQVRPGDLVFPHTGHVQLAIGNGMVVEAPNAGANVQISRMGTAVAIRRPL